MRFREAVRDRKLWVSALFIVTAVVAVLMFREVTFPWLQAVYAFIASVPVAIMEGVANLVHLVF